MVDKIAKVDNMDGVDEADQVDKVNAVQGLAEVIVIAKTPGESGTFHHSLPLVFCLIFGPQISCLYTTKCCDFLVRPGQSSQSHMEIVAECARIDTGSQHSEKNKGVLDCIKTFKVYNRLPIVQ